MPRNNRSSFWLASAFVLVAISLPAVGRAQTCASNADCAAGLTCQISAVTPVPAADPACEKGQTCAGSGPGGTVSTAVPVQSVTTCQVAPCKVDGDCAAGMVCHTEKSVSCSGGSSRPACPPNTKCDVPTPPPPPDSCVESTVSRCAFKWQLPCNTDQDCGDDFTCAPSVSGTCSSSGGVGSGGGTGAGGSGVAKPGAASDAVIGSPTVAPRDSDGGTRVVSDGGTTCTTVTSFPGYCQAREIVCTADADCPTTWTCVASARPPTRGAPPAVGDGTASTTAAEVAPAPVSPKLCQPPGHDYSVPGGTDIAIDGSKGPSGSGTANGGGQPPAVATKGSRESASPSGGSGCAVAGAGGAAAVPLLGSVLLGLVVSGLLRVRRRRGARQSR